MRSILSEIKVALVVKIFILCLASGVFPTPLLAAPGVLQFSAASYSVTEGAERGTTNSYLLITVTRTGGSDGTVSALVRTIDGSAISQNNEDFVTLTNALVHMTNGT